MMFLSSFLIQGLPCSEVNIEIELCMYNLDMEVAKDIANYYCQLTKNKTIEHSKTKHSYEVRTCL